MKKELVDQLQSAFPQFFIDIYGDPYETCMSWGIECGDYWFQIIYETCTAINNLNPSADFKFTQVKEKYGSLRIYTTESTEEIQKIIDAAELKSLLICESCGNENNDAGICLKCHPTQYVPADRFCQF